jgi:hypothetical protein
LFDLKAIDNRCQLTQDFIRFLVELKLGCNQVCKVAKRLRRVKDLDGIINNNTRIGTSRCPTYILHDPDRVFGLCYKLIFGGLDLRPSFLAEGTLVVWIHATSDDGVLLGCFRTIEHESAVLHRLPSFRCKHQVGVESSIPASQKPGLDLVILCKASFTDLLLSKGVLLKRNRERVVIGSGGMCLDQQLRPSQGCTRDGVVEGFGLRLSRRRSGERGPGFFWRGGFRQKGDLIRDGSAQVGKGLADVRRVVVGFVGVLVATRWYHTLA